MRNNYGPFDLIRFKSIVIWWRWMKFRLSTCRSITTACCNSFLWAFCVFDGSDRKCREDHSDRMTIEKEKRPMRFLQRTTRREENNLIESSVDYGSLPLYGLPTVDYWYGMLNVACCFQRLCPASAPTGTYPCAATEWLIFYPDWLTHSVFALFWVCHGF